MKKDTVPYERQIFVCTNDAQGEKSSCGDQNGEAIFRALRTIAKEKRLHPQIRVAQAKCLGMCSIGCNVMIYPENVWFSGVKEEDVNDIAEQFIGVNAE